MSKKHTAEERSSRITCGRLKRSSLTRRCFTLQDIIRQGEELFPLFLARNPADIYVSEQNTVFVGIDPERQNCMDEASPPPGPSETN